MKNTQKELYFPPNLAPVVKNNTKIQGAVSDIQDDEGDHLAYYTIATSFLQEVGSGRYNNNSELVNDLFGEALANCVKAISLDSNNAKYIITKVKLLTLMGKDKDCLSDLAQAKELISISKDPLVQLYVNNTIDNIEKLDSVKSTLAELKKKGENIELINAVEDLTDVTSNINLAVHDHKESIDQHTQQIIDINNKTLEVVSNVENQEQNINLLLHEIQELKSTVLKQVAKQAETDYILEASQTYKKVLLQEQFKALSENDSAYAQSFASNLYSHLEIFNLAQQGLFNLSQDTLTSDWVANVLKAVPAIGNTLEAINTYANKAYGAIDTITKEQKIKKINEILVQHFAINDLKLYTQEVAINMIKNPFIHNAINDQNNQEEDLSKLAQMKQDFDEFKDKTNQHIEQLKQKAVGIDALDIEFSHVSSLSLEHVGMFVEMLCRLDEQNGRSILPQDKDLETFINQTVFPETNHNIQEQAFSAHIPEEELKEVETIKASDSKKYKAHKKCEIFAVQDVVYNNPLLNNPEILSQSLNKYSLSQILDLSINVNAELINYAIDTNDSAMLLAGLISVDHIDALI